MLDTLKELGYEILLHPSDSLDLSPTDYHFFKHLNNFLQGKSFFNHSIAVQNAFEDFVTPKFLTSMLVE